MGTFKAYLKKEMLESVRTYRYLVLAAGILFFAISGPIMMKLLPIILKGQMNGADIAKLFVTTRESVLQNYVKDMFQLGLIFVIFTMSGMLSDERRTQKFVFPYAKGASQTGIVLAKLLHYGLVVVLLTIVGVTINHYYTSILIDGTPVPFGNAMYVGAMLAAYFGFNMVLALFFSAIIGKGLAAGFVTLGITYASNILNSIDGVKDFLPYNLINLASGLKVVDCSKPLIVCIVLSIILVFLTISKMRKSEIV